MAFFSISKTDMVGDFMKIFAMAKLEFLMTTLLAAFFVACGDDGSTEPGGQSGLIAVDKKSDLPECSANNADDTYLVKEDARIYFCIEAKWVATESPKIENPDDSLEKNDYTCETKLSADKKSSVIYCGGDSVGVVFNGVDGANGSGCIVKEKTEESVTVICGEESFSISLPNSGISGGSQQPTLAIVNKDISGFTQKGPFVNGSTVTALELANGHTLSQTGRSYSGEILSDDGQFNINVVSLSSQYAILRGTGYYLDEVSGNKSRGTLTLNAITDLTERNSVNINILTHLEFFRVQELVTKKKMGLAEAKKKAETEIFEAFHIDGSKFSSTEDLNIFGDTDESAALMAISIMLQRNYDVAGLTQNLSDLSNDLKEDGLWNGKKSSAQKKEIVEWYEEYARRDEIRLIREFVTAWDLGTVPNFEKYLSTFVSAEKGLEKCDDNKVGTIAQASDEDFYECTKIAANDYRWEKLPSYENDVQRGLAFSKDKAWDASMGASFPFEYEGETYNAYWNVGEWAEPGFDPGYILWPVTTSTGKDGLQKVVNYCQGFCGNAKSGSYGNLYGISLVLDNDKNFDISSWGGLCIEAESAFYIELLNSSGKSFAGTGNSFNDRNNAILNIPWSAFDVLKTEDSKIFFDLIQETKEIIVIPNNGDFHISKIGAYGSCGGNPEPSDYFECNEENEGKLYKFENSGYIENRYYKCQNSAWKEISSHEYNVGGISEEGMVGNCKYIESTHVLYLNSWFQFHTDDNNWHLASISDCTDGFSEGDVGYEGENCYRFSEGSWSQIDCGAVN